MLDHTYNYPPSLQKAKQHRSSTFIFKTNLQQLKRCDCCDRLIGTREIPSCCYSSKRLAFLGQGIPLYFLMIKNCLLMLTICLAVQACYSVYSNYVGNDCSTGATICQVEIFNQLSILNKSTQTTPLQIQNYLVLATIVLLVMCMHVIRRRARIMESACDRIVDSPSDYSMILRRLPKDYQEVDIRQMVQKRKKFMDPQQLHETNGLTIEKIVMAYSLKEVNKTNEKNVELFKKSVKKKEKFVQVDLPDSHKLQPTAIVTFSSQKCKDYFISEPKFYQKFIQFFWPAFIPRTEYMVKGHFVSIQRAPEPDDINWANCGISLVGTICRRLIGLFVTLVFLGVGAGVQIGLQYIDEKVLTDPNVKVYVSTLFSVVVSIFNGIIGVLQIIVTRKERIETVTEYNQRLAVKITFYQFLNAGVLVVISNSIFILDFNQFVSKFSLAKGLASDVTQIMIINILAPNITLFILNFWPPDKWWTRRSIKKTLQSQDDPPKTVYTQEEINIAFEGTEIDLASRYSFVLRTMLLTALFCTFTPVVIPLSIISIGLNYLIEKLLFARSYKVPNMTSSILDNQMIELLEYFPLVLALGNYFLYLYFVYFQFNQVPNYYGIPIYVSIVISVVNIFMPMDSINRCLFPLKDMLVYRPSYRQVQHKFITDYDIANPVYRLKNKKHKNYQFFANLTSLGNLFEMTALGKGNLDDTDVNSPTRQQKTPLLNKVSQDGFAKLFTGGNDREAQSKQASLNEDVKNRINQVAAYGSVRNMLQSQSQDRQGRTPTNENVKGVMQTNLTSSNQTNNFSNSHPYNERPNHVVNMNMINMPSQPLAPTLPGIPPMYNMQNPMVFPPQFPMNGLMMANNWKPQPPNNFFRP